MLELIGLNVSQTVFSVVSDEQDVVVPCLISSHNLCSSCAFWSMLSVVPSIEGSRMSPHVIFW